MFRTTLLLISTLLLTTKMNAVVKVDKIEYKGLEKLLPRYQRGDRTDRDG
jgi:hypothetical protein